MKLSHVRVRFAPSPTGLMHLGNVRTALMNYLFALQYQGTNILRIEDTDPARNFDPGAKQIMQDLAWLNIIYQEGPVQGGPYAPYFQSERQSLYQENLTLLEKNNFVYRCFCTAEELEKKRERQVMLKMPPRYDRTCLKLTPGEIAQKLKDRVPFIWRMKVPTDQKITLHDLAHGAISFDLNDFSDFPLTRQDGTATFIFANFVDDMLMKITHVLRGEDHLTNTVGQLVLYQAFNAPIPVFWHLPILFNIDGKKLSKRDFGFSLNDLRNAGYLPQAICNYLGILGTSFEEEIMSMEQLAQAIDFEHPKAPGQIKYDIAKLNWINHKWINRLTPEQVTAHALPFLTAVYPQASNVPLNQLTKLIEHIQTDIVKLTDVPELLRFYFETPTTSVKELSTHIPASSLKTIFNLIEQTPLVKAHDFVDALKTAAKANNIALKDLFGTLRYALTGKLHGMGIAELIEVLGITTAQERLKHLLMENHK